jgi:hypothetical protein
MAAQRGSPPFTPKLRKLAFSPPGDEDRQRMSRRSGIRFADKDMRQYENLRRFPVILDHQVIQYHREAL